MTQQNYTHTVWDNTDRTKTKHFEDVVQASQYANELLRQGHDARLRPYKPPKRPIDYELERLQKEGRL